ncbi:syntaxin-12-like [Ischnura elegans]|uniref:syntaxin-12-like n=1 Tax=Ischnura elegans TaxID=197161 RepID=UPI001ED8B4FA|nr:syntaxin-12-like [Ischnura elegans]
MESSYGFSSYHNGGPGSERVFQNLAQTIGTNIQKISKNVLSMQKMVNQLGTPQDSQQHKAKLHEIEHYTNMLAKDTSANLKELAGITISSSPSDERQRKMQKERLTDEFMTALNSFQKTQRWAAQKEKEEVQRVRANSGIGDPFASAKRGEQLIELTDQRERQQAQLQEELDLQALEEQEEAIRQLESDICDVNQIFKDLGAMVHEQGEIVDSIEANVEKTEVFVSEGAGELRQASALQSKVRKKKLILFICLIIIITIIITIIAVETR